MSATNDSTIAVHLSAKAATTLLRSLDCYLQGMLIMSTEGDIFGRVTTDAMAKITNKKSDFKLTQFRNGDVWYHEDNRAVAKFFKKIGKEAFIPEGAVEFPTDKMIKIGVWGNLSTKEADKFMNRLITDEDFNFEDGGLWYKKAENDEEFHASPFIDAGKSPDLISWAVTNNDRKEKWAYVCNTMVDAMVKLIELEKTYQAEKDAAKEAKAKAKKAA